MKKLLPVVLAVLLALGLFGAPAQAAVKRLTVSPATTYDGYSMMLSKVAGKHTGGQWGWNPYTPTDSLIGWGDPALGWPPANQEHFFHQSDSSGDWAKLDGWYDHGTFYQLKVTTEWQAQADCRTGKVYLPTGGAQHYARWTIPATSYCLYAHGTITEQSSGNSFEFDHTQVWGPSAACPTLPAPVKELNNTVKVTQPTFCISQWESWGDANGHPLTLTLERTQWLAQGLGMAEKIVQTYPLLPSGQPWTSYMTNQWTWG